MALTHIDALSHMQAGERGYNGWAVGELADRAGMKRLGAEAARPRHPSR